MIASKDPGNLVIILTNKYEFKLKGTGTIKYHLGCNFFRDECGSLCYSPKKYLERMESSYKSMFGSKPKTNVSSPLENGDHPELDTTNFLDNEGMQKYQSMIGALQWAVSIGRFDTNTAVMTVSSFSVEPRQGHMDRVKRTHAYLLKMKYATIRYRTEESDLSGLPDQFFE